jgi:hypothetical protein
MSQREMVMSQVFQSKFETVAYVRSPVLASWTSNSRWKPESDLEAPYGPFLYALDRLGLDVRKQAVGGSKAVLLGAYDFRGPQGPPPSLGPVESKACALFLMPGDVPGALLKALDAKAGPRINAEWSWEVEQERRPSKKMWAAIGVPDALVLCNHAQGTGQVLADLVKASVRETVLFNEYLRSKMARGEYWMVRQVRHSGVDRTAAALNDIDSEVETIALLPGSRKGTCELVTLSTNQRESPLRALESKGLIPVAMQKNTGTWITEIELSSEPKDPDAMFSARYLLGFGTYL